jgi:uncharacterized membrane protein
MLDILINQSDENKRDGGIINVSDRADKPIKSFMKSLSWRIVGTLDTMVISYFITGRFTVAVSIGSVEVITKTILYYFHERLWAHIHKIRLNIIKKPNGKRLEVKGAQQAG